MYAIIETGGKQYKAEEGRWLKVEKLPVGEGDTINFDRVLLVVNDDGVKVGQPVVEGASVVGKLLTHGRGKKIMIFKYKPKKNYRRRQGHRQAYSQVMIESIKA